MSKNKRRSGGGQAAAAESAQQQQQPPPEAMEVDADDANLSEDEEGRLIGGLLVEVGLIFGFVSFRGNSRRRDLHSATGAAVLFDGVQGTAVDHYEYFEL